MNLREELQTIYDQSGQLTPDLVVEAARPKAHPLHGHVFDQTTKDAAESWYRHRAQELIRSVRIKYVKDDRQESLRYFVSVQRDSGFVYEPIDSVVQDDVLTAIVLRDMEREWKQLQSRYGHFKEFAEIVCRDLEVA